MHKRQAQYLNHLNEPNKSSVNNNNNKDIEMKSCDNISDASLTPHFSTEHSSMSYEIASQQSSNSSQYRQNTVQSDYDIPNFSSMECDDSSMENDKNNNSKQLLYDQRATMIDHGFEPIDLISNTLQGSIWKVFYQKLGCEAVIKITNKELSKKHLGVDHRNGRYVTCKENIMEEIRMLHALNNPSFNQNLPIPSAMVGLYKVFDDDFNWFVCEEYGGRDLLNFINQCHVAIRNGKILLSEWQITSKIMLKQITEFAHWLHTEKNVCHLDISLENMLIKNIEWEYNTKTKTRKLLPTFQIKFVDFGLAELFNKKVEKKKENQDEDEDEDEYEDEDEDEDEFFGEEEEEEEEEEEDVDEISFECDKFVGKLKYESPNIYRRQKFDARTADIWSIGVCLFMICIGTDPWTIPDGKKDARYDLIVNQQRMWDVLNKWQRAHYIDNKVYDLFYRIFTDHMYRADTYEILEHQWLKM